MSYKCARTPLSVSTATSRICLATSRPTYKFLAKNRFVAPKAMLAKLSMTTKLKVQSESWARKWSIRYAFGEHGWPTSQKGAAPPFAIEAVTPLVSFGWSRNLEYLTAMQRDGDKLRVSLGVADCGSVLLELPLQLCVPLPALAQRHHLRGRH